MDEARLAEEVLKEVQRRLAAQNQSMGKIAVLGPLAEREKKGLEGAFFTVPAHQGEWEILLLAEISPGLLCELALGLACSEEGRLVSGALLRGKRVCMLEGGLEYKKFKDSAPKTLYLQYQKYEETLLRFGVEKISHTWDLTNRWETVGRGASADFTSLKVARESDLIRAKSQGYRSICLGADTILTPLARDYISNHGLCVNRRDEVRDWKSAR
mgnify:CR=1 FL=1